MVAGLPQLIFGGLVAQTSGVMYSRSLFEACLSRGKAFRTVGFMACALSQARVRVRLRRRLFPRGGT